SPFLRLEHLERLGLAGSDRHCRGAGGLRRQDKPQKREPDETRDVEDQSRVNRDRDPAAHIADEDAKAQKAEDERPGRTPAFFVKLCGLEGYVMFLSLEFRVAGLDSQGLLHKTAGRLEISVPTGDLCPSRQSLGVSGIL